MAHHHVLDTRVLVQGIKDRHVVVAGDAKHHLHPFSFQALNHCLRTSYFCHH